MLQFSGLFNGSQTQHSHIFVEDFFLHRSPFWMRISSRLCVCPFPPSRGRHTAQNSSFHLFPHKERESKGDMKGGKPPFSLQSLRLFWHKRIHKSREGFKEEETRQVHACVHARLASSPSFFPSEHWLTPCFSISFSPFQ